MKSSLCAPVAILLVDDQPENVRVAGTVLTQQGYDVIPASSAEQALQRLRAARPGLILLDVMMPGTDGLEACRKIKENPEWADIPIIFLSAADDKQTVVKALEAGGVDYLTKPFNRAELLTRVHTHLSLKEARDDLRRLAQDKDEMLGMLAHDLKNGLSGIQLSAELLAERAAELPPRLATTAENIAASSTRLLAHIRDFLANQLAGEMVVTCAPLDAIAITREVIASLEPAARRKQITLHAPAAKPIMVSADAGALRQALENIVGNALKFSPFGGTVEVTARTSDGMLSVHVGDSGPGCTDDDRARLFKRYQRLSALPTGQEPSSGLGLSIAHKLMHRMNGSLHIAPGSSRLGGAEFVLTLSLTA